MENILSSVIDKASEEIVKKKITDSLPEIEDKSDEIKNEEAKEEYNKALSEAKNKQEETILNSLDENNSQSGEYIRQVKSDLNDLGTSAGLLTVGTAQFSARIAMIPPAIISTTPMGPGVSAQMVPPMLQDLKAEGDQLSKVYDDCNSKMIKLGLYTMSSIPSVSEIISIVKTTMDVAKPLIAMVGASVGDITSPDIPEVDIPIEINYEAKNCTNFTYIIPPENPEEMGDISAENCSSFVPMTDQDTTRSCNNCKKFNKRT